MNTFQTLIWKMASIFGTPVNHWLIFSSTDTTSLTECVHPDDIDEFSKKNAFTVFQYVNHGFNYIKIADTKKIFTE